MAKKKRSISISLAAKCQLLFGLAVLVIIAGALAVPWQRMEQLAGQPNVKAAKFEADVFFRQIHAAVRIPKRSVATEPATQASAQATTQVATQSATQPATQAATQSTTQLATQSATTSVAPAALPTANWNDVQLSPGDYAAPRMYALKPSGFGFIGGENDDGSAAQALKFFRQHPQEPETGSVVSVLNRAGEKAINYRYFGAVRLDKSCMNCHTEYAELARDPGLEWHDSPAATQEGATLQAPATMALNTPMASHDAEKDSSPRPEGAAWPVVGVIRVDVPYQTDENQLLLNRIVIVVAGMVGGTLAIVVFYLITSRLILQPVRVLKNTAEKVAAGDLKIRSAISTGDEFQHLSETFNTMLATLQGSQDQLEATNRSLDTRVGELAQSNVDLFEASRLKSEFLTNVTHELRTPLNAIIGFADLMADTAKGGGDAKQQRYAENIRTSAKQLLELINDLLDLAKIEAGKLVLREEKVNVADVCEAMANFMRPLAQKKDIELAFSVMPGLPLITTDPGRFQQILYNFLSNAIKFTPAEGRVSIRARREGAAEAGPMDDGFAEIRIEISDTGPGISSEDQRVIFEKFRQIDGSVTRQHSGTGLGLAISRELAHMLGARIELTSSPGKGATFSLLIPLMNPHRAMEINPTFGEKP